MSTQIKYELGAGNGSIFVNGRLSRKFARELNFQPPSELFDRIQGKTINGSQSAVISALVEFALDELEARQVNLNAEVK